MRKVLAAFSLKNRNAVTAILVFIAAVVLIETAFSFFPQNKLVTSLQASKVIPDPVPDIQIMGDSVARDGLLAEQLQTFAPAGTVVYNYAIAGTGPEFPYFLLKRQIEAGKAPKTIIYAPSPHTFGTKRVALLVGGYCEWDDVWDVASSKKEPFEVLYGVLCKVSYTLRHREQISDILKGNAPLFTKVEVAKGEEDPAAVAARRHYSLEKLHPMYRRKFEVQPFNQHYYEKFLQLAKDNGIQVHWVSMPILSAVAESRKEVNFDESYYTFLQDAQQRFGVKVLHKEFLVFEDGVFKDYTHLDRFGAERFTRVVGEKLHAVAVQTPLGDSARR